MIDYVFLHEHLADAFIERLSALSIPGQEKDDEFGLIVSVPESLDGALMEQLDETYETLVARSEALLNAEFSTTEKPCTALNISLRDGRSVQASVRPALMNKLIGTLRFEELNEFVEAIVDSLENSGERPWCRR